MINKFLDYVCSVLHIDVPTVSLDESKFPTKTMKAYYDPLTKTLFLRSFENLNLDILFAVSHELRHIWQVKTNEKFYFSNYKPIKENDSLEEYNLQIAEVDAHAFAALLMIENFGVKPLFNGLSDSVKQKIYERVEYLKRSEFKQGFPKL